jgi:hypothetical protein
VGDALQLRNRSISGSIHFSEFSADVIVDNKRVDIKLRYLLTIVLSWIYFGDGYSYPRD